MDGLDHQGDGKSKAGLPGNENLVGDFQRFVANERERMHAKKQQIQKKEKDSKIADLISFSKNFKVLSDSREPFFFH
jgi:hypothetical protein